MNDKEIYSFKKCECGYFITGMPEYVFCPLCGKKLIQKYVGESK